MALAVVLLPCRLKVRLDRLAVRLHGLKGCGRIGSCLLGLGEASTEGLVFPREVADLVGARLFAVAQVLAPCRSASSEDSSSSIRLDESPSLPSSSSRSAETVSSSALVWATESCKAALWFSSLFICSSQRP